MSKAEDRAREWASENKLDPYSMGRAYAEGYHQAEKDNELTWEDIETILNVENDILRKCNIKKELVLKIYPKGEDYYSEILKRFKAKNRDNE